MIKDLLGLEEINYNKNIIEIVSEFNYLSYSFFKSKGMVSVQLPTITGAISSPMGLGSDSKPVTISFENGKKAYLADSMQFYLELALRTCPNGVHYIMPTFRGEDIDETHLNCFYHSEAEIQGTLSDVMKLVNDYVEFVCKGMISNNKTRSIIEKISSGVGIQHINNYLNYNGNIPKISFKECCKIFHNNSKYIKNIGEGTYTITREGESFLIDKFGGAVWLTHPEYKSVPFYQRKAVDGKYALAADLLLGIGEVVGSGERHVTYESLNEGLCSHNINENEYEWYCEMKKIAPMQTSGFGLGVERFIAWILNIKDIRNIQLVLIDLNKCEDSLHSF